MKAKATSLPATGQVLEFLLKCFGEPKDKGVEKSTKTKRRKIRKPGDPDWALYKQIKRLAKLVGQGSPETKKLEGALIDAVVSPFDNSLKAEHAAERIRVMGFPERLKTALPRLGDENATEKRFAVRLIFWIVYFIEHHEWLRPQLEVAHKPDDVLWEWIEHTSHFYTKTLADTVRANPSLLDSLPPNLSWNLPTKNPDGTVTWPICHAIEWLESLLDDESQKKLPDLLFPNPERSNSAACFNRLMRGNHLPSLEIINRWVEHPWKFRNRSAVMKPQKLKVVFLWCRALQFALKKVEKYFFLDSVWLLVEWHNRATASTAEHLTEKRKGGDECGRSNTS
jgi:hypothetical protein